MPITTETIKTETICRSTFDFISFIIGLLIGMIIMLLIVWIAYYERLFMFAYCPSQQRVCGASDYFNNPSDAIASGGAQINNILFLNQNGELVYKRVPKTTSCIPDHGQNVIIKYPQYCQFSQGPFTSTWRETAFNSNIYVSTEGMIGQISTEGNCQPMPNQNPPMTSGVPLLQWDAGPVAD